jgi:hypothetical protein
VYFKTSLNNYRLIKFCFCVFHWRISNCAEVWKRSWVQWHQHYGPAGGVQHIDTSCYTTMHQVTEVVYDGERPSMTQDRCVVCQFWRCVYRRVSEGGPGDEWKAGEEVAHSWKTVVTNVLQPALTRPSASPHRRACVVVVVGELCVTHQHRPMPASSCTAVGTCCCTGLSAGNLLLKRDIRCHRYRSISWGNQILFASSHHTSQY